MSTAKGNCNKHLRINHLDIYDKMVADKGWPYPFSTEVASAQITITDMCRHVLPQFTPVTFLDYLVQFVVANDQVSNTFLS